MVSVSSFSTGTRMQSAGAWTDVHRVEIAEHNVRSDAKALAQMQSRVCGDLKIARARRLPQAVEGARGVDKAAFHGFPSLGWFMVLIVP